MTDRSEDWEERFDQARQDYADSLEEVEELTDEWDRPVTAGDVYRAALFLVGIALMFVTWLVTSGRL